jgi:metal-responsive CopG/Arc/MetJ family transcriptional regulator
MFRGMKSKTSITLSRDLLEDLDRVIGSSGNRSRVIETAVREYIRRHIREARERRDLELINENAASLNKEARDALSYQIKL